MIAPKKHNVHLLYRPVKEPTTAMPFGLRSVGHNIAGVDWVDCIQVKNFIQLFWSVRGTGEFIIDGDRYLLPEKYVALYLVGDKHLITAVSREWEYRFITIDGAMGMDMIKAFKFSRPPSRAGSCPEELFIKLETQVKDITPFGQRQAASTAYQILSLACGLQHQDIQFSQLIQNCIDIMQTEFADPDLNINSIALKLNIHRSRLSKLFHQISGVTLIDYLISLRVHKGLSLLKETTLSIGEIAELTGYNSADYFAKAVKKATGRSPKYFRQ